VPSLTEAKVKVPSARATTTKIGFFQEAFLSVSSSSVTTAVEAGVVVGIGSEVTVVALYTAIAALAKITPNKIGKIAINPAVRDCCILCK
jgi:hypothetical protein